MKLIFSFFVGLIPLLQFFVKGWLFFGISSLTLILSYFLLRRNNSKIFLIEASSLLISQIFMLFLGFSNIPIFLYIIVAAVLIFIASKEEKMLDDLKKFIKESGYSSNNWNYELCFFGMGQINDMDHLYNLTPSAFGYGEKGIAFNTKLGNGSEYKRFIKYKDMDNFGLFRIQKKQEPYYPKIRDMVVWPKNMSTMHKSTVDTYGLYICVEDETLTFYESANIMLKISNYMEKYRS